MSGLKTSTALLRPIMTWIQNSFEISRNQSQVLNSFQSLLTGNGMSRAKYLHLLDDLKVKRWYGGCIQRFISWITADVYLWRLEESFLCGAGNVAW
jgi:hypothetical protein